MQVPIRLMVVACVAVAGVITGLLLAQRAAAPVFADDILPETQLREMALLVALSSGMEDPASAARYRFMAYDTFLDSLDTGSAGSLFTAQRPEALFVAYFYGEIPQLWLVQNYTFDYRDYDILVIALDPVRGTIVQASTHAPNEVPIDMTQIMLDNCWSLVESNFDLPPAQS